MDICDPSGHDHYTDVIMSAMTSQITGVSIVYSTVCSGASTKQSKLHATGLCEGNSLVTGEFPAQRASDAEMFPFDGVIMIGGGLYVGLTHHVKTAIQNVITMLCWKCLCLMQDVETFILISWWRHQMETFSALLDLCAGNSPVTGEFPAQRPVMRSFDVFFDLRLE